MLGSLAYGLYLLQETPPTPEPWSGIQGAINTMVLCPGAPSTVGITSEQAGEDWACGPLMNWIRYKANCQGFVEPSCQMACSAVRAALPDGQFSNCPPSGPVSALGVICISIPVIALIAFCVWSEVTTRRQRNHQALVQANPAQVPFLHAGDVPQPIDVVCSAA